MGLNGLDEIAESELEVFGETPPEVTAALAKKEERDEPLWTLKMQALADAEFDMADRANLLAQFKHDGPPEKTREQIARDNLRIIEDWRKR